MNNNFEQNDVFQKSEEEKMQEEMIQQDLRRESNVRRKKTVNRILSIVGIVVSVIVLISIFLPHAKNNTLLMNSQMNTDSDTEETTYNAGKNMFFWSMIGNTIDYSKAYDKVVKSYEEYKESIESSSFWDYSDSSRQDQYLKQMDFAKYNAKTIKNVTLVVVNVEIICILILFIMSISYLTFFIKSVIKGSDVKKIILGQMKMVLIIATLMFLFVAGTYGSAGFGLWMIMIIGIIELIAIAILGAYGDERREINNKGLYIMDISLDSVTLLGSVVALLFSGASVFNAGELEAGVGFYIQMAVSYLAYDGVDKVSVKGILVKLIVCMVFLTIIVLFVLHNTIKTTVNIKDRTSYMNTGIMVRSVISFILLIVYIILIHSVMKSDKALPGGSGYDLNYGLFITAMISSVLNMIVFSIKKTVDKVKF